MPEPEGSTPNPVDKPDESTTEVLAFREAMRDVKPLKHAPRVHSSPSPGGRARGSSTMRSRAVDPTRAASTGRAVDAGRTVAGNEIETAAEVVEGSEPLSFRRAGVRDQVIRRLRRGLVPVEDELDLHGLSQSAARDLLEEFIAFQHEAGHRCVRIIHGKGYRSGTRGPILKMLVNSWLRRHLEVLAFCSARPIDGGTGAVYVLLRA